MRKDEPYPFPRDERVSRTMSRIRGKDTAIELRLRGALWAEGLRYRKHYPRATGRPDIAFPGARVAVFCDSSFWHGRDWAQREGRIRSNREYWTKKINGNIARDRKVDAELRVSGWSVLRFWDIEIQNDLENCVATVLSTVKAHRPVR